MNNYEFIYLKDLTKKKLLEKIEKYINRQYILDIYIYMEYFN